ncbi:MAG: trigger factor [Gammaproteobacteria bacterium]|jgi:trigger factor|nr:trigger factor [Gammaproteobacteria bacterium]
MKVSVSQSNGIHRTIDVSIPAAKIAERYNQRLNEVARTADIEGFPKAVSRKQPLPLNNKEHPLAKRFEPIRNAVRHEVISEMLQKGFYEAIQQSKLNPASMPKIEIVSDKPEADLEFKASFEVFPEVEVKGLDQLIIEKPVANVTDADLAEMMETLRKQHAKWEKVERAAKDGDRVIIDFEGFMDGEKFEGGSANDVPLVLGSKQMIAGFEAGIEGMKSGESRELNLSFPADYHSDKFAGKPVMFKITVKEVSEPILPALGEELAKLFNVSDFAKLQKEVRNNMERELEFTLKNKVKDQVMDGLLKHNTVELPSGLVNEEIERLKQQALQRMGMWQKNKSTQQPELPNELFEEQAKRRVTLGLLMNKVITQNSIKPDQTKVKALVDKMVSVFEDPEEVAKHYYSDKNQMAEIEQIVVEEQVVEKILESAKVNEKPMKFSEVMQQRAAS